MYHSKNLEVQIVDHCDLSCVGCCHESPLMDRRYEDPDQLADALGSLWRVYRAPVVKLLGGEPLLHPRLQDVTAAVKQLPDVRVRLVTNGRNLKRHYRKAQGVDEIHVSLYPGVDVPSGEELQEIADELDVTITTVQFDTFRWHRTPTRHDDATAQRVFNTCLMFGEWQCQMVRAGRFYACPATGTWGDELSDGVDLLAVDEVDLGQQIDRLLSRVTPFETCKTCLGSVGVPFAHRQGWRASRETSPEAPIDDSFLLELEANPVAHTGCWEQTSVVIGRRR